MEDDYEAKESLLPKKMKSESNGVSTIQIIPLAWYSRYICCCLDQHLSTREDYELFILIQHKLRIKFSKANEAHEAKLARFSEEAKDLLPDAKSTAEPQWRAYGFQTNEPRNDFRDGGIHSLDFMSYFIVKHPEEARELFHIEQFSFALIAIEITFKLRQLLLLEPNPDSTLTRRGLNEFFDNYRQDKQIIMAIEAEVMLYVNDKLRYSDKDKIIFNNVVNNMMTKMINKAITVCGEALNNKVDPDAELIPLIHQMLKNN